MYCMAGGSVELYEYYEESFRPCWDYQEASMTERPLRTEHSGRFRGIFINRAGSGSLQEHGSPTSLGHPPEDCH